MSWFVLKDQENRKKRKGIWVRIGTGCCKDVELAIKKSKLMRIGEVVEWVEIKELRANNQVLLEVWSKSLLDCIRGKQRHNVFYLLVDENEDWVCEGDLGRGLVK